MDTTQPRSVTKSKKDGAASFINTITYPDGFGRTLETMEPSISNLNYTYDLVGIIAPRAYNSRR